MVMFAPRGRAWTVAVSDGAAPAAPTTTSAAPAPTRAAAATASGAKVGRTRRNSNAETRRSGALTRGSSSASRAKKRPVHDEVRIALDLGGVGPVVVDAVAVIGQRAEAEEQDGVQRPA